MNSEIVHVLYILAIGVGAWFGVSILIFLVLLAVYFPRKCDKCGKFWAVVVRRNDTATTYTSGGIMISQQSLSYKQCVDCGHISDPTYGHKKESFIRRLS